MCVRLPSVPARTLGEVRLDEGNFGASHTRCAEVAICWSMLPLLGRARSCKCRRPAAILGQKAGHPVDVGLNLAEHFDIEFGKQSLLFVNYREGRLLADADHNSNASSATP